ncbi:hypothetical protein [Streptomyces odonnellii]|uniref:hypothetical protein n=1 Tax=Streptomyces odonnellii TaxID=1417980 RepID=UPI000625F793|nr:hypothetical protein [Streptomyces odonnellii]
MAWDEWERLKAESVANQAAQTRLNQLPPGGGGASGNHDLVVSQDDLGAVGHEAFKLYDRLSQQADIAGAGADDSGSGTTMRAGAELKGHHFAMGSELENTVDVWTAQVKRVLQACAHISNHLDYSARTHAEEDAAIAAVLRDRSGAAVPVSRLDEFFT